MKGVKIFSAALLCGALLATAAPASAEAAAFRKYVACGKSAKAKPSHACPVRRGATGNLGAFFRSNRADVDYKICVRFPGGRSLCAPRQEAEQGQLYVNRITSNTPGRHKVTWFVKGQRVGVWFFRLR
jgi:hypothetical protein